MQNVYWMGGSPCAGKSTIAQIIAQDYGWQIYHIDRYVETYLERAVQNRHPSLVAYRNNGLKHFLSLPADVQLDHIKALSREQFEFILADIAAVEVEVPLLVEGANMIPQAVAGIAHEPQNIIWLVPTEEFQLKTYPKRGTWVQDVLRMNFIEGERISIFENWMERDLRMARWTAAEASKAGIHVLIVDGSRSIRDMASIVTQHFGIKSGTS